FEEAADLRDRAAALARVLRRNQRVQQLIEAGELRLVFPDGSGSHIRDGRLQASWGPDGQARFEPAFGQPASDGPESSPASHVAEALCVAQWLDRGTRGCVLDHASGVWRSALPRLPSFGAVGERGRRSAR
ncbi:MAG: hypothetical protein HKN26_01980, partial [Acidimicrobiales bacterium]|nr:hypothetical protein [Acidimicrobiales bacterium]